MCNQQIPVNYVMILTYKYMNNIFVSQHDWSLSSICLKKLISCCMQIGIPLEYKGYEHRAVAFPNIPFSDQIVILVL